MLRFADREAVIFRNYEYIRSQSWLREELYDLRRDPREQNNLVSWKRSMLKGGGAYGERCEGRGNEEPAANHGRGEKGEERSSPAIGRAWGPQLG